MQGDLFRQDDLIAEIERLKGLMDKMRDRGYFPHDYECALNLSNPYSHGDECTCGRKELKVDK